MPIQVTPIPRLTVLAAPAFTLGSANTAGSAVTAVSSDSTLLAFNATVPDAITFGQSGAAGISSGLAAGRDHAHAMAADPVTAAAGASTVLIATVVADDDSSVTLTGLSSTYDTHLVTWSDVVPADDSQSLHFRVGDSGGVDSGGSDYAYYMQRVEPTSLTYAASASTGESYIRAGSGTGNAAGEGVSGYLFLNQPGDGTMGPAVQGQSTSIDPDANLAANPFYGIRKAVITLDRVNFYFASGNITSGRFTVWGFAHG